MKNFIPLISVLCLPLIAFDATKIVLNDIDDLPNFCQTIMQNLEAQPAEDELAIKTKTLLLTCYADAELFEAMTNAVNTHLPDIYRSSLSALTNRENWQFSSKVKLCNPNRTPSGPDSLKHIYQLVIDKIKSDWKRTTLQQHSDCYYKYPESSWELFTKKNNYDGFTIGKILKYILACNKLGLDTAVNPGFTKQEGKRHMSDNIYLWIKEDSFEKVQAKLKLSIK